VWIIVKSKRGSEFQTWHRDFYLNDKITRTIVINLGAMKRSNVPGKAFGHLSEFSPEATTLEERKQQLQLQLQPVAPSDLKSPPETITIREDKLKPVAPSDLKSPPETITIREDKDSQELEEDLVEYHNDREESNEDKEDFVEYPTERENIHLATNQESNLTFAPFLPPFPKRTVWICDKCDTEQSDDKRRCGTCKSWRGGKRGALKLSKLTKKDKETQQISAAGRKKRIHLLLQRCLMLLPVPVCHLRAMTC
jgi:hypothetical protein